jgi:hypothetical protein
VQHVCMIKINSVISNQFQSDFCVPFQQAIISTVPCRLYSFTFVSGNINSRVISRSEPTRAAKMKRLRFLKIEWCTTAPHRNHQEKFSSQNVASLPSNKRRQVQKSGSHVYKFGKIF